MDKNVLYILFVGLLVMGVAALMELYKKSLRRNKSKSWENTLIAAVLSGLSTLLLVKAGIFIPIFAAIGAPMWLEFSVFCILFWCLQLWVDMSFIKKLIRTLAIELLEKAGLEKEYIDMIMAAVDNAKK